MSKPVGQENAPIATAARDFQVAKQEWEFPRGNQNRSLFIDEQWNLNKESYNANFEKYDCCNVEKGGGVKGIECAFKRVYGAIPDGGNVTGAPHGGTTGIAHARANGIVVRTTSGQR